MDNIKGRVYLIVFIASAVLLGLGIWKNYRPQVIYASCVDIAEKTTNIVQRKDIFKINEEKTFEDELNSCLSDSGYYGKN